VNLFRPAEVYLLADAISAMVFRCERTLHGKDKIVLLMFEERESFRLDLSQRKLYLTALSGIPTLVYSFSRWPGDWLLWRALKKALFDFEVVVGKVRLHDVRAFFGRHLQEVVVKLADLMDAAEAERREIIEADRSRGGAEIHPKIKSMLQVQPPAQESMYTEDPELELESPHAQDDEVEPAQT